MCKHREKAWQDHGWQQVFRRGWTVAEDGRGSGRTRAEKGSLTSSMIPDEDDRVLADRKPVEDTRPCLQFGIRRRTQGGVAVFKDDEATVADGGDDGKSDAGRKERRLGGVGRRGVLRRRILGERRTR
ncbi:hypothetical protein PIB30_049082 [Stylosanthes scabra]|uniref:Uncharacterized protein n=1 Tax=Stylosanthes scabra TaxID=79078 RepID=A0ABU6QGM7_9FABA|nr:hypothetical protein [Stylosanthes scabra]